MNIVLVSAGIFQEYILINIRQLLKLNHKSIYILTNECFFDKFQEFPEEIIKLVSIEELNDLDIYDYRNKSSLDKDYRNGFWYLTSMRFFYIYAFMNKYQIIDVIHLENDVPIYYNCDILLDELNKEQFYIPFDCYDRTIASIVYIPNAMVLNNILSNYDTNKTDMNNFSHIQKKTGLINNFPIFVSNPSESDEYQFVTKNFDNFQYIFDAAAIGQYIGGIDPIHTEKNTIGFVNETCIIKYNNYKIIWKIEKSPSGEDIKRPFILENNKDIPIFNLHIHCKDLQRYL